MFERFTANARAAVDRARQEAIALGHEQLGPEHLLIGVLVDTTDPTAQSLNHHGVTVDAVRNEVALRTGRSDAPATERVAFSPTTKQAFAAALLEAKRLRRTYIGTEHLVLAILRDPTNVATQLLVEEHAVDYPLLWNELAGLAAAAPQTRPFLRMPVQFPPHAVTQYRRRHLVSDVQALLDENARLRRLLRTHGIDPEADPRAGEEPA